MSIPFTFAWSRLPFVAIALVLAMFVAMALVESASAKNRPTNEPDDETAF